MAEFLKGLNIQPKHEKDPDFVLAKLSFKVEDFIQTLREKADGGEWVNAKIKKNKEGKLYIEHDNWQKGGSKKESGDLGW